MVTSPYLPALFGYALGTAQVLSIDWAKRRQTHRKDLRLIQAELRRLAAQNSRFKWESGLPVGPSVRFPKPPSVTPAVISAVVATDFSLTDEHDDDNAQQAFLTLLDGCEALALNSRTVTSLIDHINDPGTPGDLKTQDLRGVRATAARYDEHMAEFQAIVESLMRDMERRLRDARFFRQLRRGMRRLRRAKPKPSQLNP